MLAISKCVCVQASKLQRTVGLVVSQAALIDVDKVGIGPAELLQHPHQNVFENDDIYAFQSFANNAAGRRSQSFLHAASKSYR